jgi:hypothetical protein
VKDTQTTSKTVRGVRDKMEAKVARERDREAIAARGRAEGPTDEGQTSPRSQRCPQEDGTQGCQ